MPGWVQSGLKPLPQGIPLARSGGHKHQEDKRINNMLVNPAVRGRKNRQIIKRHQDYSEKRRQTDRNT